MTDPTSHEQCTCDHEDRYHFADGNGFVVCRATTECLCTWREKAVTSKQQFTARYIRDGAGHEHSPDCRGKCTRIYDADLVDIEIERLTREIAHWKTLADVRARDLVRNAQLLELAHETSASQFGKEPWRVSLPVITPGMFNMHGGPTLLIEVVEGGKLQWTQAAVDFACFLQELRQSVVETKADPLDGYCPGKRYIRSKMFEQFLRQGFWHAHHVDLVWRYNGEDVREQADWLKDVWYALREDSPEWDSAADSSDKASVSKI